MTTRIITTRQTADLAVAFAHAISAHLARPTLRNAKALMRAEQAFRASRIDDLVASVQIAAAVDAAA